MRKNFIFDTNVLLHEPGAVHVFADNVVNIPIYVIEEIDNFKKDLSELGRNARLAARLIDSYRAKGCLRTGVETPDGGLLRVLFTDKRIPEDFSGTHKMDNLILAVALDLKEREPERPLTFITKDTNLRIRADALGLHAEDYDRERIDVSELYTGASDYTCEPGGMEIFYREQGLPLPEENGFHPNEYLTLRDPVSPNKTALARINKAEHRIEPLLRFRDGVFGIRPRNREQHFAIDVLMRDGIQLVTLLGKAGTGKTLLALAAGLAKATEEQGYRRLLVSRPIYPLGKDIGFLPGGIEDKLNPWMQPIHDNVELLLNLNGATDGDGSYAELLATETIQVEPLTYIRGRSIPHQFMIVDEAQNLTPHEVKTIITRVGHGTKIVFTGDPYQIDNPYVDSVNNGLSYLANRFKEEPIAGAVTLSKGERSELAELAANLL